MTMHFHVIEDEKHIGDIIVAMLDAFGFTAEAFLCPLQYIEYAQSSDYIKPIAIMTDVMMPGITGYEMISRLRKIHPDLQYAVISATPDTHHAAMYNVDVIVRKPIKMEMLGKAAFSLVDAYEQKSPDIDQSTAAAG